MAQTQREIKAAARRSALSDFEAHRQERVARERRKDELAIAASTALAERRELIVEVERRAGEALDLMVTEEGMSLRDAVEWIGGDLTVAEAKRLRQAAAEDGKAQAAAEAAERAAMSLQQTSDTAPTV